MKNDAADTTLPAALALVERSIAGLASASLELSRSRAWNDVLATLDHLATLLGAEVDPPAETETGADPAQIGRFVSGWLESLLLSEYLEQSAPGRAQYRVRLPEEARADGLGDLVDFLESLALRLDLSVDGAMARLALSVGGAAGRALVATCGGDRLHLDLDLAATRGALRHLAALVAPTPAGRTVQQLELEEVSGVLHFSYAATGGRLQIACALREPLRIAGRNVDGPLQIEVGRSELLTIDGDAAGTLRARVEVGAVHARLPASMVDPDRPGTAEYHLSAAGGELQAGPGERALELRRLTLGGGPAVERHDGEVVASVELMNPPAGLDLTPDEPGRFVLTFETDLSLRLGASGQEVTLTAAAGSRLRATPGRLQVLKGRLVLAAPGAAASVVVGEGRSLVRRREPRSGEPHPLLGFYESTTGSGG